MGDIPNALLLWRLRSESRNPSEGVWWNRRKRSARRPPPISPYLLTLLRGGICGALIDKTHEFDFPEVKATSRTIFSSSTLSLILGLSPKTFTAPLQTFTAPLQTFTAPLQTFTASLQTFTTPLQTFPGPLQTFLASPNVFRPLAMCLPVNTNEIGKSPVEIDRSATTPTL